MKRILTALLLIFSLNAFSQAEDPADGDGTVPVGGGIALLVTAGTAYGARMVRKTINKRQRADQ